MAIKCRYRVYLTPALPLNGGNVMRPLQTADREIHTVKAATMAELRIRIEELVQTKFQKHAMVEVKASYRGRIPSDFVPEMEKIKTIRYEPPIIAGPIWPDERQAAD